MADDKRLDQMKQKYSSVLTAIQQQQIRLSHVHIQDNKLFIQGSAPSEEAKNKVWDQIKQVNPNWAEDLTADLTVDADAKAAQAQGATIAGRQDSTYTVQAGDSLSKISKELEGNASEYMKIVEANRDVLSDHDKSRPGQTLKIPA